MTKPFFSIVIPTYNRADDLKIAIKHVLNQTYRDFEIVISDNASTDQTTNIVKSFNDKRIKYSRNKTNIEVLPNLRKAVKLASGRYVILQGDDDFIIDRRALFEVRKIINKYKVGFIRLNYLSLSRDKKNIFDFRISKHYKKNVFIGPNEKNFKIIDFLLKSEPSFIAGIVFKNDLKKGVEISYSQLRSWFPVIFHTTKLFGGIYINKPYFISGWSVWRFRKDSINPLYSVVDGRLTSEKHFSFIEKKLEASEYRIFLRKQLKGVYVSMFMAVKLFTDNRNLLKLASRIRVLDPELAAQVYFKVNLMLALIMPRFVLNLIRKVYLFIYIMRNNQNEKYNLKEIIGINS